MAGNAIGFGNFLRFPIQAIENGGGAFIIPYLVCFILMGIPLLFVEWTIGRYGGKFGFHSTPFIMNKMGRRYYGDILGFLAFFPIW
jgi:SNF family Na+-dependent transporter